MRMQGMVPQMGNPQDFQCGSTNNAYAQMGNNAYAQMGMSCGSQNMMVPVMMPSEGGMMMPGSPNGYQMMMPADGGMMMSAGGVMPMNMPTGMMPVQQAPVQHSSVPQFAVQQVPVQQQGFQMVAGYQMVPDTMWAQPSN